MGYLITTAKCRDVPSPNIQCCTVLTHIVFLWCLFLGWLCDFRLYWLCVFSIIWDEFNCDLWDRTDYILPLTTYFLVLYLPGTCRPAHIKWRQESSCTLLCYIFQRLAYYVEHDRYSVCFKMMKCIKGKGNVLSTHRYTYFFLFNHTYSFQASKIPVLKV